MTWNERLTGRRDQDHGRNVLLAIGIGAAAVFGARSLVRYAGRYDLRRKVVLITGGSRGLGLVLARHFLDQGARVAICARDEAEVLRARNELWTRTTDPADVLAVQCDVTVPAQVQGMVDGIVRHFGRIDVLVNNAGIIQVGPVETMTIQDYEDAMRSNFFSMVYCTTSVLPQLKANGEGRVVNITSIGGKISVPHLLPYSASKFAAVGFSEGLRSEVSKDGIAVTTICPGLMRTGSPRNAFFKGRHREEYTWFSVSDSLPLLSMDADRAARKIIDACIHGDAEVVLGVQAKLAAKFHDLFPGLTTTLMGWANHLLPEPGGIGQQQVEGKDSHSEWSPSSLTTLSDQAAVENNEMKEREVQGFSQM
jgi:NAD(P)-dependent dehydrogenase (short-subunit alcohol dehydrogenase family)